MQILMMYTEELWYAFFAVYISSICEFQNFYKWGKRKWQSLDTECQFLLRLMAKLLGYDIKMWLFVRLPQGKQWIGNLMPVLLYF